MNIKILIKIILSYSSTSSWPEEPTPSSTRSSWEDCTTPETTDSPSLCPDWSPTTRREKSWLPQPPSPTMRESWPSPSWMSALWDSPSLPEEESLLPEDPSWLSTSSPSRPQLEREPSSSEEPETERPSSTRELTQVPRGNL